MSTLATLNVVLNGDIGGFLKSMKQAEEQSSSSTNVIQNALSGIGSVAKVAAVGAVAAIGAISGAAIAGVKAFNDWADQLDSIGDVLGTTADESAGLAVAIRGVGGDVDALTGQMAKFSKSALESGKTLNPVQKDLKALGISIYEVGKVSKVTGTALPSAELAKLSDKLTTATARLHDMEAAYAKAKSPTETATLNLAKQRAMVAELSAKLESGGKTITRTIGSNGPLKDSATILQEVATKLAAMPDGLEKTRLMTELFGKSGKDLSDTLNALANGGLDAATEKAKKLGLAIGDDGVNRSIEFGKSMENLKMTLQGVVVSIGSTIMPVLQPLIKRFSEWAMDVMPRVRQAIQDVFGWIQTNVLPIVQTVLSALSDLFGGNFQGAFDKIAPLWNTFWGTTVPQAVTQFSQWFSTQWDIFWGTTVPTFLQKMKPYWDVFWGTTLPAAIATFSQWFSAQWDLFWGTTLPVGVNQFAQWFSAQWDVFWGTTVPNFVTAMKPYWDVFWGTTVPAAIQQFTKWFSAQWDLFWGTTVPTLDRNAKAWLAIQWDTFWNKTLPMLVDKFIAWIGPQLQTLLTVTIPALFKAFSDEFDRQWAVFWNTTLPAAVKNFGENIIPTVRKIGEDIIEGLIKGLMNVGYKVGEALKSTLDQALADLKKQLGIQSPSTVFAGIGSNMMQGLALGITRSAQLPRAALDRMAANLPTDLNATLGHVQLDTVAGGLVINSEPRRSLAAEASNGPAQTNHYYIYDTLTGRMVLEQQRQDMLHSTLGAF